MTVQARVYLPRLPRLWGGGRLQDQTESFKPVAARLGAVGLEIADIDAVLSDCAQAVGALSADFVELAQSAETMRDANRTIVDTAQRSQTVADATGRVAGEAEGAFNAANREIAELLGTVSQISTQLQSLQQALENVRTISTVIATIARRTDLLALNAAVEAARAGDAGKGFAVVAGEVKRLALQTSTATGEITEKLGALTGESMALIRLGADAAARIATVQESTGMLGSAVRTLTSGMGEVQDASMTISTGAQKIDIACNNFVGTVQTMRATIDEASQTMAATASRMVATLRDTDDLVGRCATSGIETVDTPIIATAVKTAAEVAETLSDAILRGDTTVEDLFDHDYRLIPGSNPEQFMTRGTLAIENAVQETLERLAAAEPRIVFCAAIDVNGYMPANLLKYSQPQGPDPVWNKANCRNRWIFRDRTGQGAGKNTQPFLLQTYRRDMGGGNFVLMKDASAPIYIAGRHWGGFRIAYKTD